MAAWFSSHRSIDSATSNHDQQQISPTSSSKEMSLLRASCPVNHSLPPSKCPVRHDTHPASPENTQDDLNPLNMMPNLSQSSAPGQRISLPTERVASSIPRSGPEANDDPVWVYPSPQQFYNALKRKGWETPEEEIEVIVDIHNELNENCWREILKWEELHRRECDRPKLLRLRGRPSDRSPKARLYGWLYGTPPPFDRHDWYIDRCGKEVRYIIDYYSAPDEGDTPVFFLDVRPALDSPSSIFDRIKVGFEEWWKTWQKS